MDRRKFLQFCSIGGVGIASSSYYMYDHHDCPTCNEGHQSASPKEIKSILASEEKLVTNIEKKIDEKLLVKKNQFFNSDFEDDLHLREDQYETFLSVKNKLLRIQNYVGYGNFNIISFDEMIRLTSVKSELSTFSKEEYNFMEELFYFDAKNYGFMGEKVFKNITHQVSRKDSLKIAGSGHYLLQGTPVNVYEEVVKTIGSSVILTSGVRSVVKQMFLFVNKVLVCKGNLSKASRSVAPPGYSHHGKGDFDIGKIGLGRRNFTKEFSKTDEYKKLMDLGYIEIRYPKSNKLGVRFEPWHIKVSHS